MATPVALSDPKAAGAEPRRLCHYNAGFLWQPRIRRILELAGHPLRLGRAGPEDGVLVWGHSPYAHRGEAVAKAKGLPLFRVEDAFLRSIRPGRAGDAPIGLMLDDLGGVHFDASTPSRLERILLTEGLDDTHILTRARNAMARLQALDMSKYNNHDPELAAPAPGYVLVIDQTRGDASIRHSGASETTFREMLATARIDHPRARIVIKTHPETRDGLRPGHYGPGDLDANMVLLAEPVSPWKVLEGAVAVFTVSSQLGFEAILAGHRPRVFGQPFYAGWGLTTDERPVDRRRRSLTKTQLFAGAMIHAPLWYDPCRDRLCSLEEAIDQLEAEVRAFRENRTGHVASGMRLWKRGRLAAFFGGQRALRFVNDPIRGAKMAGQTGRNLLIWAGKEPEGLSAPSILRVEDGFLRSRGLGAELVPPLSLIADDLGIYYDPTRDSRLEHLILAALPPGGRSRAESLVNSLKVARLSKYNLGGAGAEDLPKGHRILVPGQVEDDASIRLGAGEVRRNLDLLRATRAANPEAALIYKPHPDVEAGLRPGLIAPADLAGLANHVAAHADPIALIETCDEVWTMTSLLGFEALLRGKKVTTLGAPFYAGWGLTRDLGPVPARRRHAPDGHPLPRPDLIQLAHATLIAYPRYFDPISRRPCPPEVAAERLANGEVQQRSLRLRLLAKLQGAFAGQSWLWR